MLARITFADYVPRNPDDVGGFDVSDLTVRIVGRAADGRQVTRYVEGCVPHVYLPDGTSVPQDSDAWTVRGRQDGYEAYDGTSLYKTVLAHPKQAANLKREVDGTYEADIPFYRRATWDYGLSGYVRLPTDARERRVHIDDVETDIDPETVDPISPRVLIGDLEVLNDQGRTFDEMKQAADRPIIAATWYDTYEEDYTIIVVDAEGATDPSVVRDEIEAHWGDHDLAADYLGADMTLEVVGSEADLLKTTVGLFQRRQPDIASGWNFADFDWYYLLERLKTVDGVSPYDLSPLGDVRRYDPDRTLSVQKAVAGLPAMDQMEAYCEKMTFTEWRSKRLEYVANEKLGIGKIEGVTVADAYENRRSELVAYNLLDVQLCAELSGRYAIEEFFLTLADLCAIQVYDTFSEKREVDGYIASRRDPDEVLPNQVEDDIEQPAGGLVLSPSSGVQDDVAVFDLKSLYPSSMLTCNISPETLTDPSDADVVVPGMPETADDVDGEIDASDLHWAGDDDPDRPWSLRPKGFDLDAQGVLPKYVAELFIERERFKDARDAHEPGTVMYEVYDRRQQAIKVIMNSFYGVSNSEYFRLARDGVGDAITGISRYVLWRGARYMEKLGYEVVYGDTDSVLVRLTRDGEDKTEEELVLDARGIENQLNAHMSQVADDLGLPAETFARQVDHGTDRHCWTWEFEKLYTSFLQCGNKKRYAGRLCRKDGKAVDDLDVTGFEAARSDVMERTAAVQGDVIKMVLAGADFQQVSDYVRQQVEQIDAAADDFHEIGLPMALGQPLSEYGNTPRARAARYSNRHLDREFGAGDKPFVYYVKRTPTFQSETDVIALEWHEALPDGYELDRQRTIEKAFEGALTPIVEEMGWTFNEVREGKRTRAAAADAVMEFQGDPWADSDDASSEASATASTASEPSDDASDDGGWAW